MLQPAPLDVMSPMPHQFVHIIDAYANHQRHPPKTSEHEPNLAQNGEVDEWESKRMNLKASPTGRPLQTPKQSILIHLGSHGHTNGWVVLPCLCVPTTVAHFAHPLTYLGQFPNFCRFGSLHIKNKVPLPPILGSQNTPKLSLIVHLAH
jgi:hypothetical protein